MPLPPDELCLPQCMCTHLGNEAATLPRAIGARVRFSQNLPSALLRDLTKRSCIGTMSYSPPGTSRKAASTRGRGRAKIGSAPQHLATQPDTSQHGVRQVTEQHLVMSLDEGCRVRGRRPESSGRRQEGSGTCVDPNKSLGRGFRRLACRVCWRLVLAVLPWGRRAFGSSGVAGQRLIDLPEWSG